MARRGNQGYGKMIADAALADQTPLPKIGSWLDSWIEPVPRRNRARSWLSMFLKADLKNIPPDQVARYLEEMASDVRRLGSDEAVERFIDKILPRILPNEIPEQ